MNKPLVDYLRFRISRDCEVVIGFYGGEVTQEGIEMARRVLELSKDCFPKAEEPKSVDLDSSRSCPEAHEGVN